MIKVLIADDYELARWSTQQFLNQTQVIDCLAAVKTGSEALAFCRKTKVDVVLIDVTMPELGGIETTKEILADREGVKVLAYTAHHSIENIDGMIKAGAHGYVLKSKEPKELIDAIVKVFKGGYYFSDTVMSDLVKLIKESRAEKPSVSNNALKELTRQERRILEFIALCLSNKEIALKLNLSPRTIETHKRNLAIKLALQNPKELHNVAIRLLKVN